MRRVVFTRTVALGAVAACAVALSGAPSLATTTPAYSVDPVTAANSDGPSGIAVDGSGNLFVSNYNVGTVDELVPRGDGSYAKTLIASSGMGAPTGLALGASGDVFVADAANGAMVKLVPGTAGYTQYTVATSGLKGAESVAVDPSGDLFVTTYVGTTASLIELFPPSPSDTAAGYTEKTVWTSETISLHGIAVDSSGEVLAPDYGDGTILKFTPGAGGVFTESTLDLTGVTLDRPTAIAVDSAGAIYVTGNSAPSEVVEFTPVGDGTYAGTTLGWASRVGLMAVDSLGNLFFTSGPGYDGDVEKMSHTLTVTATSATLQYGAPTPAIIPTYSGFIDGDTAATAVTTPPPCNTWYAPRVAPGTYQTDCDGGVFNSKYAPYPIQGLITVVQDTPALHSKFATGGAVAHRKRAVMTIVVTAPYGVVPTGAVHIHVDGRTVLSATLVHGRVTVTLPAMKIGAHKINYVYLGNTDVASGTSATVAIRQF